MLLDAIVDQVSAGPNLVDRRDRGAQRSWRGTSAEDLRIDTRGTHCVGRLPNRRHLVRGGRSDHSPIAVDVSAVGEAADNDEPHGLQPHRQLPTGRWVDAGAVITRIDLDSYPKAPP